MRDLRGEPGGEDGELAGFKGGVDLDVVGY